MKQNRRKHPTTILTLDDMRDKAREDAAALIRDCNGLNKAAKAIGMSKGRLSFINAGKWTEVAVNEVDLAMLATGRILIENELGYTQEARELAQQIQKQMSELHDTVMKFIKVARRL